MQEDIILIRSWLNVSKDTIIGVVQSLTKYWARIKEACNNDDKHIQFLERKDTSLKSRWNQIHPTIRKFIGCYKQALNQKISGSLEKDIMDFASKIYKQDIGKKFEVEHA